MAVWELALLIAAATFFMVNTVSVVVNLIFIIKFGELAPIFMKAVKKMVTVTDKVMDKTLEDIEK